jgi:small subunit ribosomal protein S20
VGKSLSVLKRVRQSEKRRQRNLEYKNGIKESRKKIRKLMEAGASQEELMEVYRKYSSAVDKAVKKNVIHKNNAARKKSRMNSAIKKFVMEK